MRSLRFTHARKAVAACVSLLFVAFVQSGFAQPVQKVRVDIAAQDLSAALTQFGRDTGTEIVFSPHAVREKKAAAVKGDFERERALELLLKGSGLTYRVTSQGAIVVERVKTGAAASAAGVIRLAQNATGQDTADSSARNTESLPRESAATEKTLKQNYGGIPEVLVTGSRILNMDVARSVDDAQPYVIFERETIERSGADTLEEFLKYRLTMNTQSATNSQVPTTFGTASTTNLRGLGAAQTLVLIDGRRVPSFHTASFTGQGDLNTIPLAAIERIEVLPTTASGIYGGGATGGVINVILRRDYTGAELRLSYENTFDTDAAIRRIDVSGGFELEDGRTDVLLAGSYSDQNGLRAEDRDFERRGRARILANNPGFFFNAPNPPLGATTNIRSANGSPLFGPGTPNFTSVPVGYTGGGGLTPLQANAGTYNFNPANNSSLDAVTGSGGGKRQIGNAPTVSSLTLSLRRQMTAGMQMFVDVGTSRNQGNFDFFGTLPVFVVSATAPNNPFGQALNVTVPIYPASSRFQATNDSRRATGGAIFKLPGDWQATADYTWARFRSGWLDSDGFDIPLTRAAVADGTLDVLRDLDANPLDWTPFRVSPAVVNSPYPSTLKDATVRFAGPVGTLPGGQPMLSVLLEHRDELFGEARQRQFGVGSSLQRLRIFPSRSQSVVSAYAEAKMPLVSSLNRVRGIRELELQLAARHDEYEVSGVTTSVGPGDPAVRVKNSSQSTDPTVGLRYEPTQDLMLRGSYGTGFFPPGVTQLVPGITQFLGAVLDPRRGNEPALAVLASGGNPNLEPERSKSLSVGFVLTPRVLHGVRLSVDYTHIEKTDNIVTLPAQKIVDNESVFPDRVTRGPVEPGDPFAVGPITALNTRVANIAEAEVEAYDVALDYRLETERFGAFDFSAMATWQTHLLTRLAPSEPAVENVGIGSTNPLKLKANFNLSWQMLGWTVSWATRYLDSYLVADPASAAGQVTIRNQGSGRVPSQVYHDLYARYRFERDSRTGMLGSLLDDTEIQLGVQNVFNTEPPFDAGAGFNRGFNSLFGDPRLATYQLSVRKQF